MIVSIIVVNWNTREQLRQCLEAVQSNLHGLDAEVIVVDNASSDGSSQMVQQDFPRYQLIQNQENAGFARANNLAIRASTGRYILLLNSDAFLDAGAVQKMVSFLDGHVEAGIAGANLRFPNGTWQWSHGPLPTLSSEIWSLVGGDKLSSGNQEADSTSPVSTGTVSGACLMARRSMLEAIGLLDEGFFMFSEEVDLCSRAHQAGWKVYHLPDARVVHIGGGSTGLTANRILMLYRGKWQYFAKHNGVLAAAFIVAAMRLFSLIKWQTYRISNAFHRDDTGREHLWRAVFKSLAQVTGGAGRAGQKSSGSVKL